MTTTPDRKVYVAPVIESLSMTETRIEIDLGLGIGIGS